MTSIRISLSNKTRKQLTTAYSKAQRMGDSRLAIRIRALLAAAEGAKQSQIASILKVSAESIRLWIRDFLLKGLSSLNLKSSPGRPGKLTVKQKKMLEEIVDRGPHAAGYPGQCWRSPMIQDLIFQNFGVFYSVHYVSELLKNLGFSFQKAKFESAHLDEKKRKKWLKNEWPEIQRLAVEKDAMILFGDEASFPQWGTLNYTWSKRGKTPVIKTSGKRKGYKAFGLIEYFTGKFFCKTQEGRLDSDSYMEFLEMVMDSTQKHLIIIQDGARYHTSQELKEFFDDNSDRITVFQLPSYSPDFNPIEKLWKKIKEKGTHLHYFPTFDDLKDKVDSILALFETEAKEVLKLFGFYKNAKFA